MILRETWGKLKQYFPKAPEFPKKKVCSSQCKILEREGQENKALHKMVASKQKTSLQNLCFMINAEFAWAAGLRRQMSYILFHSSLKKKGGNLAGGQCDIALCPR